MCGICIEENRNTTLDKYKNTRKHLFGIPETELVSVLSPEICPLEV